MIIFAVAILVVLVSELVLFLYLINLKTEGPRNFNHIPISILIPARNEEKNLPGVIRSLLQQEDYHSSWEILVGDDNSSDNTSGIIETYSNKDSRVRYFKIEEEDKRIGGKAGVLDILIKEASGDIILVADADMTYPKNWLQKMSYHIQQGRLVSSFTRVKGNRIWDQWQNLDWLLNLSGVKLLSTFGFNLTAIGNNMGFLKKSYEAIPGFSKMKGFITEDLELLNQMKEVGIPQSLIFSDEALGATQPALTIESLLAQRMRWMSGAFTSPVWLILGWALRVFLIPMMIALAISNLQLGILFLSIHLVFQVSILLIILKKLKVRASFISLLSFDFFYLILNIVSLSKYLVNSEITWKDRNYSKRKLHHDWIH